MSLITYTCSCDSPKTHRLIFDSGQSGQIALEVCHRCYLTEEKKFLIFEERIDAPSSAAPAASIPDHNARDHHKQSVK